jgi:hypothetical protein
VPGLLGAYCQHGGNHSQFTLAVAKRARWRLFHDEMRYKALRSHATKLGLSISEQPGIFDVDHLVERLASLQLEPDLHPYTEDKGSKLGHLGTRALRQSRLSTKRRLVMSAWWWFASRAPRRAAGAAITWKLAAGSRPAIIDKMAKLIRKLSRPSQRLMGTASPVNPQTM